MRRRNRQQNTGAGAHPQQVAAHQHGRHSQTGRFVLPDDVITTCKQVQGASQVKCSKMLTECGSRRTGKHFIDSWSQVDVADAFVSDGVEQADDCRSLHGHPHAQSVAGHAQHSPLRV